MRRLLPILCPAVLALAACHKSPQDVQADELKKTAAAQADRIIQQSDAQVASLRGQADQLKRQASQAGGYTGQRLNVHADALDREAEIVRKQGRAQADATREAADAQAKQIASR